MRKQLLSISAERVRSAHAPRWVGSDKRIHITLNRTTSTGTGSRSTSNSIRNRRVQLRPGFQVQQPQRIPNQGDQGQAEPVEQSSTIPEDTSNVDQWIQVNCSSDIQVFTSFLNVTLLQKWYNGTTSTSTSTSTNTTRSKSSKSIPVQSPLSDQAHTHASVLESTLQTIYNALSVQQCDSYFRQVLNVSMLGTNQVHTSSTHQVNATRTVVGGPGGFGILSNNTRENTQANNNNSSNLPVSTANSALFQVTGVCRGCRVTPTGSFNLFDDGFRLALGLFPFLDNNATTNATNHTLFTPGQCFCKVPSSQSTLQIHEDNNQHNQTLLNLVNQQLVQTTITPAPTMAPVHHVRPTHSGDSETQGFTGGIHLGSLVETTHAQVQEETQMPSFMPTQVPTSPPSTDSGGSPDFWFNLFPADLMVENQEESIPNQPTQPTNHLPPTTQSPFYTTSPFYDRITDAPASSSSSVVEEDNTILGFGPQRPLVGGASNLEQDVTTPAPTGPFRFQQLPFQGNNPRPTESSSNNVDNDGSPNDSALLPFRLPNRGDAVFVGDASSSSSATPSPAATLPPTMQVSVVETTIDDVEGEEEEDVAMGASPSPTITNSYAMAPDGGWPR
ncbi:expressed unknown protein [Seminavis robusta]|uniref:Uncharacterized protein n=1 Tax=Seminavis robusta TaxID=568900 RepID=A0A9N8DDT0_9STRA|nr:expressed unknown protein [Seminavis robusta]|eukprot:Sro76_g041740.1 n/a (615) ;mRNA; r:99268-101196